MSLKINLFLTSVKGLYLAVDLAVLLVCMNMYHFVERPKTAEKALDASGARTGFTEDCKVQCRC